MGFSVPDCFFLKEQQDIYHENLLEVSDCNMVVTEPWQQFLIMTDGRRLNGFELKEMQLLTR
jgi:hypothetical protein